MTELQEYLAAGGDIGTAVLLFLVYRNMMDVHELRSKLSTLEMYLVGRRRFGDEREGREE